MRARIAWIVTLSSLSAPAWAADETFFRDAARNGMAEIALGQLASTKGSSEQLKAFGRQMMEEHAAAKGKLAAAAAKSGVTLPTDLDADTQATQTKLRTLSGRAFDQAYTESQRKAHAQALELLQREIESGTDSVAKAWARETLPTVKRHAEMIGSLNAAPGEHEVEHAVSTPGLAEAPPVNPPPR